MKLYDSKSSILALNREEAHEGYHWPTQLSLPTHTHTVAVAQWEDEVGKVQ